MMDSPSPETHTYFFNLLLSRLTCLSPNPRPLILQFELCKGISPTIQLATKSPYPNPPSIFSLALISSLSLSLWRCPSPSHP